MEIGQTSLGSDLGLFDAGTYSPSHYCYRLCFIFFKGQPMQL